MTARTQVQLAVLSLGAVAVGLGAVLVFRSPESGAGGADAGRECIDPTMPGPLTAGADDTPLLLWPEKGARLTLDGSSVVSAPDDPRSFSPGEHKVKVACQGGATVEHRFVIEAWQVGGVFVECKPDPAFLFINASCRSCPPGSQPDEDEIRKRAAKAPKDSGLRSLSEAQQTLQRSESQRQCAVLMQRWNLLTDRYFRVLGALGQDATDAVDSAQFRFESLSKGVLTAHQREDAISLEESVRAGEETLSVLIRAARSAHPADCDFQQRLTKSF
jgi:hypothetical protein